MTRFVNLKRRNGKTLMLIHTAYVTGYPILTSTTQQAHFVKGLATKMGLENIEVYSLGEWKNIFIPKKDSSKVLIDEAENIINYALRDLLQAEVVAASFSIPMLELPTADKDEKKEAQDNADN